MRLFDSIAHPTIDGKWFNKDGDNTFPNLISEYNDNEIIGGCAVSLPFIGIEGLRQFYNACKIHPKSSLYPVAAINFTEEDLEKKIIAIKEIGYKAIKIHIRLSKIDLDKDFEKVKEAFVLCEKHNLTIFFCTYYHNTIEYTPTKPLNSYLTALLKAAPNVKIILLHGGDVSVMQVSQLARFNPNILIDLSYTFLKFKGSSVENDIIFLMNNFDKKICFGSDYPEYPIATFKNQLDKLALKVTDKSKLENFYYKNIMNFLNIDT